jgi:two-component system, probable response regulator PhcQ
MLNHIDYKKYAILYVDDETMALKYFEKTFGAEFRVLTAENAEEGLKLLEKYGDEIAILLSDQRMPGQKGVQMLEQAMKLRPRIVRMLITAYADYGVTVDAVNIGNIFRYVSKPIQVEDMRNTLRRAMEYYAMHRERDELLSEKLSVLQKMIITDRVIGLGVLAAGLSQTLRNPIDAVQAFVNLAPQKVRDEVLDMDRLRDSAFWQEFHSQVVKQAARVSDLLGEIDGVSCSGRWAFVNQADIDPTLALQASIGTRVDGLSQKGIEVISKLESKLPKLRVDRTKFRTIFDVLLDGALHLLPKGSTLTISSRLIPAEGEGSGNVEIIFADDGPGLPLHALRSIFDPFAKVDTNTEHFGLRLMSVYFLVHHHGGTVTASNQSGGGMKVVITLPVGVTEEPSEKSSSRDFVTKVLMNETLWEKLLTEK